jgi:hypothetical protein
MPPIHASKRAQKDIMKAAIGKTAGQSGGGSARSSMASPGFHVKTLLSPHLSPPHPRDAKSAEEVSYIEFGPKIAMKNRILFAIRLGRGCLFSAGCDDF